jgi:predicted acetyltransferase
MFQFLEIDQLQDEDISLVIERKTPEDLEKGYVPSYRYQIYINKTTEHVGAIEIRIGYNTGLYYGGHIGYTIFEQFRGNHYALKACELIKEVAKCHQMEYIYITCNPDNLASRKTCEKLGLELLEVVDLPEDNDMYLDGERQKCIFKWNL